MILNERRNIKLLYRLSNRYTYTSDKYFVDAVVFHIIAMICKNMLVQVSSILYSFNSMLNYMLLAIIGLLYVRAFFRTTVLCVNVNNQIRIPVGTFLVLAGLFLFIGMTIIVTNDLRFSNEGTRNEIRTLMVYGLPLFISISCIKDVSALTKAFYNTTPICVVVAIIVSLVNTFGDSVAYGNGYSMPIGYSLLPIAIMLLFKYSRYKRISSLICFFLIIFFIINMGSRGPLVYIAISFGAVILRSGLSRFIKWLLIVTIILSIVFLFFDPIVKLIDSFNLSSRTISYIKNGRIFADSGRGELHDALIKGINESPIIGHGAFGTGKYIYSSHGIFFDVFANFGYVIGTLVLGIILLVFLNCYRITKGTLANDILVMLFVLAFSGSVFNGGVFSTKELWMLFGVMISCKRCGNRTV